ncbi:hypothetical protein SH449x_002057 [Pirellulaceae bacterium SH449]
MVVFAMPTHRVSVFAGFCCAISLLVPNWPTAHGQAARYQLGKQVIAFEEAFEAICSDSQERAKPLGDLQKAVRLFFALSLPEAERAIDQSRLSLLSKEDRQAVAAVAGLRLKIAERWVEIQSSGDQPPTVELSLVDAYESGAAPFPKSLSLTIDLFRFDDKGWKNVNSGGANQDNSARETFSIPDGSWKGSLALPGEGDFVLRPMLSVGEKHLALPWYIVSATRNRDERLESILTQSKEKNAWKSNWFGATLKLNAAVLRSTARNSLLETDYPVHQILQWLEKGLAAEGSGEILKDREGPKQFWLDMSDAGRSGVVRMQLPSSVQENSKLPVIVAYHGAGGSENMFFDAYGAGRLAQLADDNGYLLVTPRQPLMGVLLSLPALLDKLDALAPIDRDRIVVMGHSMGAGQAISQLDRSPGTAQAAVILGGGRAVAKPDAWKGMRTYAAGGDKDFGLGGVQAFAKSMKSAGITNEFEIFDNTEHLGIVQVAWDNIFRWLGQSK